MWPSARNTTRFEYDAEIGSCVTITIVWPNSCTARCMNPRISRARARVEVAGGLVGEHDLGLRDERARDRDALLLAARQLRRSVLEPVAQTDGVDDAIEPRLVGLAARRATIGSVMFSSAVSVGIRLNVWNTKPMRSRRTRVSSFSDSVLRSMSPR